MILNILPEDIFFFVVMILLILVAVMYFTFRKHEMLQANAVISTNKLLIDAVTELVNTMDKAIEQNTIDSAIASAESRKMGEINIE